MILSFGIISDYEKWVHRTFEVHWFEVYNFLKSKKNLTYNSIFNEKNCELEFTDFIRDKVFTFSGPLLKNETAKDSRSK